MEFEPIRSPASPPRNAVSPILFIKSPQYQPAPSPPVIDIDIEEEEPARPVGEEMVEIREEEMEAGPQNVDMDDEGQDQAGEED